MQVEKPVNAIGVCDNHDSGACLYKDGRIVFAVNEERLNREKLTREFPWRSINSLPGHIHDPPLYVASEMTPIFLLRLFSRNYAGMKHRSQFSYLLNIYFMYQSLLKRTGLHVIEKSLSEKFISWKLRDFPYKRARLVDHHMCHSAGAYYASGFSKALVITCDAMGDGLTLTVSTGNGNKLTRIYEEDSSSSISTYYSRMTEFLGFKALRHEGKVLGLAAYGDPGKTLGLMRKLMHFEGKGFIRTNLLKPVSASSGIYRQLRRFRQRDIAAGLQKNLEIEFSRFVMHWQKSTGLRDLCLAGGLFANVKLNQRLHEISDNIFIFPNMGDGGLAAGAVLSQAAEQCKDFSLYLGPEYSDSEIRSAIDKAGFTPRRAENPEREIAGLLAKGKVVARFYGRMEYGPRALGNRSILYRPDDPKINDWLNKQLNRTEFMPFAPSVLYEDRDSCFLNTKGAEKAAKYMAITFECTPWMRKNCPGVVHIDGTARPQLVEMNDNPPYYSIIKEFKRMTGLPCLVNTSFNMHEEPIVCSPEDAIKAFRESRLDYLAIGKYLVKG